MNPARQQGWPRRARTRLLRQRRMSASARCCGCPAAPSSGSSPPSAAPTQLFRLRSALVMVLCPNLSGGPNPVPTPRGGWGHEKSLKNNCVPNLTARSQPLTIHSCGRTKNVGTMLSIRQEKDPRWGHRGWDHIQSSHWPGMIKICPNPLEGWDRAFRGWDRGGPSVDHRPPLHPWSFSLGCTTAGC